MPARPAATAAAPAKNAKASKASGGIVAAIDAVAAGDRFFKPLFPLHAHCSTSKEHCMC